MINKLFLRIYIAGPMTGVPQFNFPAFDNARDRWQHRGWEVTSPADMDREYWREHFGCEFDLDNRDPRIVAGGDIYEEWLRMDVAALARCDAVALLPGWEKSKGVARELLVARALNLPLYDAITGDKAAPAPTSEPAMMLSSDSTERKSTPVVTGVLDYFPLAIAAVARLSKFGNDKHNAGQPLHWSRGKSYDHADCIGKHLIDRGAIDPDFGVSHTVPLVWRALALLELEEEERLGKPISRGSR